MQKDAEGGCAGAGQEQLQHFKLTNEFMYHQFYWKKPDPIRIPTILPMVTSVCVHAMDNHKLLVTELFGGMCVHNAQENEQGVSNVNKA